MICSNECARGCPFRCCCKARHRAPCFWNASRIRRRQCFSRPQASGRAWKDRKSTRLNSSHGYISYAVFCLKKKKNALARSLWRPVEDYARRVTEVLYRRRVPYNEGVWGWVTQASTDRRASQSDVDELCRLI